jgi:hypothetical protein
MRNIPCTATTESSAQHKKVLQASESALTAFRWASKRLGHELEFRPGDPEEGRKPLSWVSICEKAEDEGRESSGTSLEIRHSAQGSRGWCLRSLIQYSQSAEKLLRITPFQKHRDGILGIFHGTQKSSTTTECGHSGRLDGDEGIVVKGTRLKLVLRGHRFVVETAWRG